jgi:hypothetical protein
LASICSLVCLFILPNARSIPVADTADATI